MSSHQPKIAFCITCKDRGHHIRKTLPQNLVDNQDYENAIFILVNYNSQDTLMEEVKLNHSEDIESGRLVVYSALNVTSFKMAHAKNVAHRCAIREGAEILVNLDADNLTGPGFATYIAEQFTEENIFLWAKMIPGVLPRGISGRIVVTKDAYLNVGGYDEQFETWGRDDKDFNERLCRAGYIPRQIEDKYLGGVRHNDKLRFKEYPHVRPDADHYEEPPPPNTNTICNWGVFGLCICTRNFELEIIEILPLPTRIFGIGMHKTGTASLSRALEILGFVSGHWKNPKQAKAIWKEMKELERSLTLEKYYAICDLPITLLYEELDRAYPCSKFILTIRDEQAWLNSVEKHWSYEANKHRASWDKDYFTHRIHRILYGQKQFDREIMLARYRKHNADVLEYFKDRPNDLLVLRINDKTNWNSLCKFLNVEVPSVPFPRKNITPKIQTTESNCCFYSFLQWVNKRIPAKWLTKYLSNNT